jgi:hypothetical protein
VRANQASGTTVAATERRASEVARAVGIGERLRRSGRDRVVLRGEPESSARRILVSTFEQL